MYDLDHVLAVRSPVSFQNTRDTNIQKQVKLSPKVIWLSPVARYSNIGVHQNHTEDLLKQIAGSHFQNLWFNRSEVGFKNLLFKQGQGCCWCCWWSGVQTRRSTALLRTLKPCFGDSEGDTAFLAFCCCSDSPVEQLWILSLCQMLWLCAPRLCALLGSFLHLCNQEIGPNPQAYRITILNFYWCDLWLFILTSAQGILILTRVWES